eukprot:SAG11_NODE_1058_length_6003_cov_1.474424_6_plen_225_part_00
MLCLTDNGAGKTTTINILTGMLCATSGDATIVGMDIKTHMHTIRKSIGCCPQHDILWLELTVREHLETFAKLKGLDPQQCVLAKIQEVGLTEKANTKAGELSGGMKRKLSLCMALISDSAKVLFLDEPTSGMVRSPHPATEAHLVLLVLADVVSSPSLWPGSVLPPLDLEHATVQPRGPRNGAYNTLHGRERVCGCVVLASAELRRFARCVTFAETCISTVPLN